MKLKADALCRDFPKVPLFHSQTDTFQRKFILIDSIGPSAPCKFVIKKSILPELEVSAEESVLWWSNVAKDSKGHLSKGIGTKLSGVCIVLCNQCRLRHGVQGFQNDNLLTGKL